MTIKIKYNRAFDVEDVCGGDILLDRQDNNIAYMVARVNLETEEFICVRLFTDDPISRLLERIGFECIDEYIKIDIDELL